MEFNLNLPEWLKIPLKVLIPAMWLFSGTMILLPDQWLQKLYLLEWAQKNGFKFGLIFVITSCLLLMYGLFFAGRGISSLYYKLTLKRRTFKKIVAMSDVQQVIIYKLYNAPGYTTRLDYNQPVIQGLLGMKYIYAGGQQQVTVNLLSNSMPMYFTLQPFVYQALDYYRPKVEKKIEKMERKVNKTKDSNKKKCLAEKLNNAKGYYEVMYNGGLN